MLLQLGWDLNLAGSQPSWRQAVACMHVAALACLRQQRPTFLAPPAYNSAQLD